MARYKSFIDLKGTLGGLTFYEGPNGERLVKKKNTSYEPKSLGIRMNMAEMGGGSTIAKHFRHSFLNVARQFGDQYACGRLNGRFRDVIAQGAGAWGERAFDLRSHPALLIGFQLQDNRSLSASLSETLVHPQLNATRDLVRWELPRFLPKQLIQAPESATHFELVLVASQVSQGVFDARIKAYTEVTPVAPNSAGVAFSALLPLDAAVAPFVLEVAPGTHLPTPDSMAVVVCVWILFSTVVNGVRTVLKDGKAMDVVVVG